MRAIIFSVGGIAICALIALGARKAIELTTTVTEDEEINK